MSGLNNRALKTLNIIVSVDWEGRNLASNNLECMQEFRRRFPEIPIQQFLNAAYYTKEGANPCDVSQKIRSVLSDHDEHGLHVHGWRSLFSAALVTPKERPTLFDSQTPLKISEGDWGHEVCIDAYTTHELRRVVRLSNHILVREGFRRPKSFRAGAWLAADNVLEALALEGFDNDCSAAWIKPLQGRWGSYHLYKRCLELWPDMCQVSQPYHYRLGNGLSINEIPNNGCLADYVTADDMVETVRLNLTKPSSGPCFVSLGFHQETAHKFLHRLVDAIPRIKSLAKARGAVCNFVTAAEITDWGAAHSSQ